MKLPLPDFHVCPVNGALGIMECQKMLRAGVRPAPCGLSLHPFRIGAAHGRRQGGILPIGLALPAHPGIPGDVQHRGQSLGNAHGPLLSAYDTANPLLQLRVPGGSPADA